MAFDHLPTLKFRPPCATFRGRIVVLIDMDDVVTNCNPRINEYLADYQEKGMLPSYLQPLLKPVPIEQRRGWNVVGEYATGDSQVDSEIQRIIVRDMIYGSKNFFTGMTPIAENVARIKLLAEDPFVTVKIVSDAGRNNIAAEQKRAWLHVHMGAKYRDMLDCHVDKSNVQGDLLIDDKPNIYTYSNRPSWVHALFLRPFNDPSLVGNPNYGVKFGQPDDAWSYSTTTRQIPVNYDEALALIQQGWNVLNSLPAAAETPNEDEIARKTAVVQQALSRIMKMPKDKTPASSQKEEAKEDDAAADVKQKEKEKKKTDERTHDPEETPANKPKAEEKNEPEAMESD